MPFVDEPAAPVAATSEAVRPLAPESEPIPPTIEPSDPEVPKKQDFHDKPVTPVPAQKQAAGSKQQPLAPDKKAPAKAIPEIPGYYRQQIEGFNTILHGNVPKHNGDSQWKRKPSEVLELELHRITRMLPQRIVKSLHKLLVWVEWEDTRDPDHNSAVAKYHGMAGKRVLWALDSNKHPLKARNIEIINMKALTAEHQLAHESGRCVLFHEFAHAVHFEVVAADNPYVDIAFATSKSRGLCADRYAGTSAPEYFAELSCAYFDTLNYEPRNRRELQEYDPVGYRMMEQTWGSAKALDRELQDDEKARKRKGRGR
jgi:hypothetical protein